MAIKKFTIECEMPERWINDFCSFLKHLEYNGQIGHSAGVGFYADGDGDFRPTFNIDTEFKRVCGRATEYIPEKLYDAG